MKLKFVIFLGGLHEIVGRSGSGVARCVTLWIPEPVFVFMTRTRGCGAVP